MSHRQRLVDDLIRDEGDGPMLHGRHLPYVDTTGHVTIGHGRNLTDNGISSAEAMLLLDHDIDDAITDLSGSFPWFVELDAVRQRVITNMRFNLGGVGFRKFKRLIQAMREKDYRKAAASMQNSKWYGQVGRRSVYLVQQMLTGEQT